MKLSFKRITAVLAVAAVVGLALVVLLHESPRREGSPSIGGPFTLVNHLGETVTDADFRGHFLLLFFGYTYCPDVCPTTLTAISDALDLLGSDGDKVTPAFVTVDPERDTPEYLKEYLAYFHPRLVGLTGTSDQVAAAAGAYRVYYAKGGKAGIEDYIMDHTSVIYLMDPAGNYLAHFANDTTPEDMASGIGGHLKR
jgi:cytochrome oxidase Cu insertion factor (SCO1/SenC/PrrC family)